MRAPSTKAGAMASTSPTLRTVCTPASAPPIASGNRRGVEPVARISAS